MGLADLPRVYFHGFTYWNPSTMNNNDYQPTYDPASATLNWPWLERHGLHDEDGFDSYVTGAGIVPEANDALNVNITTAVPPAEWNFYGDNSCGFVQEDEPVLEWPEKFSKPPGGTTVSGFTDVRGALITSGDPWIGQPIRLNPAPLHPAKLVDVDPVAPWSSQIFLDRVGVGPADGSTGLTGATAGRAHSRWVFFGRNLNLSDDVIIAGVGSSMFQTALPRDRLKILDSGPAPKSLAAQLRSALKRRNVRGLMLRFVAYHTVYFQGSAFKIRDTADWPAIVGLYAEYAAAAAAYERGELDAPPPRPVNRAYSNIVGWLAPWTRDDMRTMAVGRALYPGAPVQPVSNALRPLPIGPAVLEYAVDEADPARVGRVVIDLGTTVPELESALTKVDFGTLQLALTSGAAGATPKPFAEIPYSGGYDAASYVATSGVIEIPASQFLTPLSVADIGNRLVVMFENPQTGTSQVGLTEADYTAETDDRAVYLDEPGAPWSRPDPSLTVQVRYRGGKPPAGTLLRIAQYAPNSPGFGEDAWRLVSDTAAQSQTPFVRMNTAGTVEHGAYVTVPVPDADDGLPYGAVTIGLSALRSGPPVLQFTPLPAMGPVSEPPRTIGFFAITQQFFANVRVLPFHNAMTAAYENWLRTGPSVDLATQRAFDAVFRTFFLMYPAMRFIRDPLQFQAWRGPICAVTDPATFETADYMPVMRSLSAGQRKLLELWNAYLDGTLPTRVPGEPLGRRG